MSAFASILLAIEMKNAGRDAGALHAECARSFALCYFSAAYFESIAPISARGIANLTLTSFSFEVTCEWL